MAVRQDDPIGIFDSGLGGLTVTRAVMGALPAENIVYLGDTARVPYGTRSSETVIRYAQACAAHLRGRGIKLLVVACNTVSAVALDLLRVELDCPVLGVIEPGARAGVRASRAGRIGVLATAGTVASGAYERAVGDADSRAQVVSHAAPLLVPLAEEGWLEGTVPELVAARYMQPFVASGVDTVILGCTHYPLLRDVITRAARQQIGADTRVVDSAEATVDELAQLLTERGMAQTGPQAGQLKLLVTDVPGRFADVASRFLGRPLGIEAVEQVDL